MKIAAFLAFTLAAHVQAVSLRRSSLPVAETATNTTIHAGTPFDFAGLVSHATDTWGPLVAPLENRTHQLQQNVSHLTGKQVPQFASYAACFVNPNACQVNSQKVAAELGNRIVLLFGCSLDIYALDYFCKAAGAPIVGFQRSPGVSDFALGNLAYCRIGTFILAYSFHPGVSGPPYFGACTKVLKGPCDHVTSAGLIHQSVQKIIAMFGAAPTAIVVDSSLWDAASWWIQDNNPAEPYIAPPGRVAHWCQVNFPALIHNVQMMSPTSKIGYRTAPRVEFIAGYGHSMHNIEQMNQCFRASSISSLMAYTMIDYGNIVEMFLTRQGGLPSGFFEDAFHPGVLPSVLYVDWVLQWAKTLPVGR